MKVETVDLKVQTGVFLETSPIDNDLEDFIHDRIVSDLAVVQFDDYDEQSTGVDVSRDFAKGFMCFGFDVEGLVSKLYLDNMIAEWQERWEGIKK